MKKQYLYPQTQELQLVNAAPLMINRGGSDGEAHPLNPAPRVSKTV